MVKTHAWVIWKSKIIKHGVNQVTRCTSHDETNHNKQFSFRTLFCLFDEVIGHPGDRHNSKDAQGQFVPDFIAKGCAEGHALVFEVL